MPRPVFPDWVKLEPEVVNATLDPVWAGKQSAQTAALALAKQLNDYLAANPQ